MPVFSRTYCNVDDLNLGLGYMEAFTEQPSLWSCHLRTLFALFQKKKRSHSAVYSHVVVCSSCCTCVVSVDFRVFRKKNVPFSR